MQSKNKDDSVQLPTRYQQYDFAKRHLRECSSGEVFPFGEADGEIVESNGERASEHSQTVTGQGGQNARGTFIKQLNQPKHSNDRVYGEEGVSPTLNTMQGGNRQPFISDVSQMGREGKPRIYKDHSPTISARDYKEPRIVNNIRRLTPTECERLQGFPDSWTTKGRDKDGNEVEISDSQRYKCLGNAVTTNMIRDIMVNLI